MQSNRKYSLRGVKDVHNATPATAFGGVLPSTPKISRPMHGVEFQPSEICPQNFVIFDQTDDRSQIMFYPAMARNLSYPQTEFHEIPARDVTEGKFGNNFEGGIASPFHEDSDDIDALLSLDEGDSEEEEVSTARTQGDNGSSSPESCSNYPSKGRKIECPSSFQRSGIGGSSHGDGKRKKMRKMVKALRGMVPGGDQMNTVSVLDEAVKYLKCMKVEVQKLGIGNLKTSP